MQDRKQFYEYVSEIGEWSRHRYGDHNGLNYIAPLLRIVEEMQCEYLEMNFYSESHDEAINILCNSLIYLADFCHRAEINTKEWDWIIDREDLYSIFGVNHVIGRLSRACLENIQDAYKFNDPEYFDNTVGRWARKLFDSLQYQLFDEEAEPEKALAERWHDELTNDFVRGPMDGTLVVK